MQREALSNIEVLIVGAGLGGLVAAIECYRQGHSPRVVESRNEAEGVGDFLGIGPSAINHFQKWPPMAENYRNIIYKPDMIMYTYDGTLIGGPLRLSEASHWRPVPVSRPKLARALYDHALSLGIPIMFGKRIAEYGESEDKAYAIDDRGERFDADVVVAADGIGTKAGKIVPGKAKAVSSGWSVYRVSYPTMILQEDPVLSKYYSFHTEDQPDYCDVFMSPKGQVIILVSRDLTTWLFTHEDKGEAEETWTTRKDSSLALQCLQETGLEWDERIPAIMKRTPPGTIVDYKITWRDPNPTWTSPGGRVVKIGDAAHAFIPNSTNGATQAMEDGISLAACLKLSGKNNITLATRVHTKLRFERTSCAQKQGFRNKEKWEKDFDLIRKDPLAAAKSVGRWTSEHNPEQYVYDKWQAAVNHIVSGAPFQNTNLPPGYEYEPWTMDSLNLLAGMNDGEIPADPGDWD
ncbi:hypothetical protein LTS17_004168 [Exophiala oligosperma]